MISIATMKDVAQMAGVSTATVSRALMNPEKVSAPTRLKVEQAATSVGYSPHSLVRNLKRNESHTILVIVPNISDPFFVEVIKGIEETAAGHGYLVLLGDSTQQNQEKSFLNLILAKQVDGMVLLGSNLPFDASKDVQKNLPPMVMANEFASELELPTVHIDNLTASFNAIHYLHQLGHQRIACICGPENMHLSQYRKQGYIQALQRSGIAIEESYLFYGDFSYEAGAKGLSALMSLPQPPTAIFCHSDVMAIGALSQAKKLGLNVPLDLSIIGFDNITLTQYSDPPLTTVAQPCYQIGQQAMLLLLKQLQGQAAQIGSLLLESELLIRGSTAAPRS